MPVIPMGASHEPEPGEPARPLATTAEVAAYLQLPPKTVKDWRTSRTGPAWQKIGRHVRYDWADVKAWVAAQRRGGVAA